MVHDDMTAIYQLELGNNDFEGAMVDPIGCLTMPVFDCSRCGAYGSRPSVWYASFGDGCSQMPEEFRASFPEKVNTSAEFHAFRQKVHTAFQTQVPLWPGYLLGASPMAVKSRRTISELNSKKLREGIDVIWAGLFNLVVSSRALDILKELRLELPTGKVQFVAGQKTYADYSVLELQPQAVWTEEERTKYGVKYCEDCGSTLKTVLGGTYKMKQFRRELFGSGNALVRGQEANGIYVNQPVYERLMQANLTGLSLRQVGQWG